MFEWRLQGVGGIYQSLPTIEIDHNINMVARLRISGHEAQGW